MSNSPRCLGGKPIAALALLALVGAATPCLAADPPQPLAVQSHRHAGSLDRVEVSLDVGGDLKVADAAKGEGGTATVKMSVVARLNYDEKCLGLPSGAGGPLRSLRHYDTAEAAIKVGEDGIKARLREDRRLIAVEMQPPKVSLFSPAGSLTREELDLVDLLGNSLILDRLLPDHAVARGDTWKPARDVVAALCGLDEVRKTDVQCTLSETTEQSARVEIAGKVEGSITGLPSKIELKARYRFNRKTARIDWFALVLRENREKGLAGPGLDVAAKLQMTISPLEKSSALSDDAVKKLALAPTDELHRLAYASPDGRWQMAHDRRWIIVSEKNDAAVLRMVDQGDYLAQCSITAPKTAAKNVTLSDFQDEIRQALGKSFQQFVRAAQSQNDAEYRVYRVDVDGLASEVPIRWTYYMLADEHGRRAVIVFAVEGKLLERFGRADEQMIGSIRFTEPKLAAKEKKQ